ncbi:MAG: biopolymer transporter ExbD [Ginsengibacter sp.]
MARAKIKRGSTTVDMTPMCDVAFLLLTFFILVGKFKAEEAVEVTPPTSVANKTITQKDYFNVTFDKGGTVYLDMDEAIRKDVIEELGKERNVTFSPQDINAFANSPFVAVPISQLSQFLKLTPEQIKGTKLPGVPTDSTNNELQAWISAAKAARMGSKLIYTIKGDMGAKYSTFRDVVQAFKKNDEYKYNLVTSQREVPAGSELYQKNLKEQTEGSK